MLGLILVLLTAITAPPIDALVTLTYDYLNPALDIRCALEDITSTAMSTPVTISLARTENGKAITMVSSSFMPEASPSTQDVRGAEVTSNANASNTSESYINLHWPVATSSLEGDYKCVFMGLDNHYQVVKFVVSKSVTLAGLQPDLCASPEQIKVGLTQDFSLRCSFVDLAANHVSQIESVNLFHVKGDIYDLLASITLFSPAQTNLPGQKNVVVSGSVDGPEPYLEISWKHPTHSHAGQYACDVLALDLTRTPVHFNRTLNVTTIDSRYELLTRILNLEADVSHLNSSGQNTSQDLTETRQELTETRKKLSETRQELTGTREKLTETRQELTEMSQELKILKSHESCEKANMTSSRQIVRLNPNPWRGIPVEALCEVTDDGKTWTVFQRRFDQSVDFNRSYTEYENGFGSVEGEFWLGLKNIVKLMGHRPCELRIDMVLNNQNYTRIYPTFVLDPADYKLTVGGYDDNHRGLSYNNRHTFYTYDRDTSSDDCARSYGGGWWYDSCTYANMNGKPSTSNGFLWYGLTNSRNKLSASEMKFRWK